MFLFFSILFLCLLSSSSTMIFGSIRWNVIKIYIHFSSSQSRAYALCCCGLIGNFFLRKIVPFYFCINMYEYGWKREMRMRRIWPNGNGNKNMYGMGISCIFTSVTCSSFRILRTYGMIDKIGKWDSRLSRKFSP
jgi:hypothetical protein